MVRKPIVIKDRVAEGDDIFLIENLPDGKIRLIPDPSNNIYEAGTDVNKALMQPWEDIHAAVAGSGEVQLKMLQSGRVIRVINRGEYDASTEYDKYDYVISAQDNGFVAKNKSPKTPPPEMPVDSADWQAYDDVFNEKVNAELYKGATWGSYSVTPLISGLSCEFRMDFPIKSIKFGYYALAIDGQPYTDAVPVNQPIRTVTEMFNGNNRISVLFYDLRSIMTEDWGTIADQSWDSLLNQKWFTVGKTASASLELALNRISELAEVQYGTLKTIVEEVTE